MTEYLIIPKVLPVRNKMEYDQKIPKIIWQTIKTNRVPVLIKHYADSWIGLNPEYEYRFYNDNDIFEFINTYFPEFIEGYKKIKYGASKADLWRYLIIYKYGGVYADMDCRCMNPLRQWIEPEAAYVSQLGINKDFCQWLIISVPENPVFLKAAKKTIQNLENNTSKAAYHGFEFLKNKLTIIKNVSIFEFDHKVLGMSGPPVLQEAAEACFKDGSLAGILPFTQFVCISKEVSCQMNGNVRHDSGHAAYRKALRKLKTIHYDQSLSRVISSLFNIIRGISK